MLINIKDLRNGSITEKSFEFFADISDTEPSVVGPVKVFGEIINRADVLLLYMTIEGTRNLVCDRCAKEFSRVTSVPFHACIVEQLDNEEEDDDFIICEGEELDIEELAISMFILGFDSKNLCEEDCKGLCQKCGANLNEQACSCKEESVDPRLEILAQLLDD